MSPARADSRVERAAPLFAALGDPTRLQVVSRLSSGGPMSITQLTDGTEVTRQAVTRHLEVLREAGLVCDFRRGRERLWELETKRIDDAHSVLDLISERWDLALERLRDLVEE